jgi:hypothetical protein
MNAPRKYTWTRPVVDGKPTTFVALGKRLGVPPDTASRRYRSLTGPVAMAQLRAWDKTRARRERRDERIRQARGTGAELKALALKHGLTPQRISQIDRFA